MKFFKILHFLIFDIFLKKMKNIPANFVKMDLLIHMKCNNLIPKFQRGTMTLRGWKIFQSWKKRSQNFAFLDTLGYFVTLWPNGFSWLHQIWHTSSQDSSAFSCKILNTSMTWKCHFLTKKSQKMLKITKIWVFWAYMLF